MTVISEKVIVDLLQKLADGTFKQKYPVTGDDAVVMESGQSLREYISTDGIPSGIITMWSGSTIPNGWVLCDGSNGTPNLTNRFIVGAGGEYDVGATGGEANVELSTTHLPPHTHGSGNLSTGSTGSHIHGSGTLSTNVTGAHSHGYKLAELDAYGRDLKESGMYGIGYFDADVGSAGAHSHSISGSTLAAGTHTHSVGGTSSSTGGGASHENRPPYYALAFIMKV